jgi:hypothetical protein
MTPRAAKVDKKEAYLAFMVFRFAVGPETGHWLGVQPIWGFFSSRNSRTAGVLLQHPVHLG